MDMVLTGKVDMAVLEALPADHPLFSVIRYYDSEKISLDLDKWKGLNCSKCPGERTKDALKEFVQSSLGDGFSPEVGEVDSERLSEAIEAVSRGKGDPADVLDKILLGDGNLPDKSS